MINASGICDSYHFALSIASDEAHTRERQRSKEDHVKFVIAYTSQAGSSAEDNVKSGEAAQKLLANWMPSPTATIHQWVQRCDGNGGFSVLETDNAADLLKDLATWSPWLKFELFPVLDVLDATVATQEAIETARSVL
jgi:hypothetical protein